MKESLRSGTERELRFVVPESKTVPNLYPESELFGAMPEVFATGFFVGLVEWACIRAVNPHLDWPSEQTLGTHVDLTHEAATPPGLEVTVRVRLEEVDGRRLRFGVEASDGMDVIGRGSHWRFVIDRERFDGRIERKRRKAAEKAGDS
jgi:fluoroacetyl-CoA thioesterase